MEADRLTGYYIENVSGIIIKMGVKTLVIPWEKERLQREGAV